MNPGGLTQPEYTVCLWERGLLSNAEAICALTTYCTALTEEHTLLRAAVQAAADLLTAHIHDQLLVRDVHQQLIHALTHTRERRKECQGKCSSSCPGATGRDAPQRVSTIRFAYLKKPFPAHFRQHPDTIHFQVFSSWPLWASWLAIHPFSSSFVAFVYFVVNWNSYSRWRFRSATTQRNSS